MSMVLTAWAIDDFQLLMAHNFVLWSDYKKNSKLVGFTYLAVWNLNLCVESVVKNA